MLQGCKNPVTRSHWATISNDRRSAYTELPSESLEQSCGVEDSSFLVSLIAPTSTLLLNNYRAPVMKVSFLVDPNQIVQI